MAQRLLRRVFMFHILRRERLSILPRIRLCYLPLFLFFFQAEDGIRDVAVTGVQTCALPISGVPRFRSSTLIVSLKRWQCPPSMPAFSKILFMVLSHTLTALNTVPVPFQK